MNQLPTIIPMTFILTIGLALFILFKALRGFTSFFYIWFGWLLIQAILGLSGFYQKQDGAPRFLLLILPPLAFVIFATSTARGRSLIGQPDLKWLTLMHTLRIPVEIVLFWLFIHQ